MFSGIVEGTAKVLEIETKGTNRTLRLTCPFVNELSAAESVSHNGVCLTLETANGKEYTTTAMQETLIRSNLGLLKVGDEVNLERALKLDARLDGHIVQGHVDQTAICTSVKNLEGSYVYRFKYEASTEMVRRGYFTVDKGSVCVNGVSLTVCNPTEDSFEVNIIPYTFEHTNFHSIKEGTCVNLEFDILGKYIARLQQLKGER